MLAIAHAALLCLWAAIEAHVRFISLGVHSLGHAHDFWAGSTQQLHTSFMEITLRSTHPPRHVCSFVFRHKRHHFFFKPLHYW